MKYFGTDGIRGLAFSELNEELARKVAWGLWKFFGCEGKKVLIGGDTRVSTFPIILWLTENLASLGFDVHVVSGPITTPGVSFSVRNEGYDLGIVVSASHNPPEYNGVKLINAEGYKFSTDDEDVLETYMDGAVERWNSGRKNGIKFVRPTSYFQFLQREFPEDLVEEFEVIVDCGFGATGPYVSRLFRNRAEIYNALPLGTRINVGCGAASPGFAEMIGGKGKLVFSYDGDGDRVLVYYDGRRVGGDELIYLFAVDAYEEGQPVNAVFTVLANEGVLEPLRRLGIRVKRVPVGDREVSYALKSLSGGVGGEDSGHVVIHSLLPTGDGILTSLYFLKLLKKRGKKWVNERVREIKHYPQVVENIRIPVSPLKWMAERKRVEEKLAHTNLSEFSSRVVLRTSGTEPLVRVLVEGDRAQEEFAGVLERVKLAVRTWMK